MLDLEINILEKLRQAIIGFGLAKSIMVKIEEVHLEMVVMVFQSIQSTYAK